MSHVLVAAVILFGYSAAARAEGVPRGAIVEYLLGDLEELPPLDTDSDGIPNAVDPDDDNDGIPDATDPFPLTFVPSDPEPDPNPDPNDPDDPPPDGGDPDDPETPPFTAQAIPGRVGQGASVVVELNGFPAALGIGSALAGPDRQRGGVSFVLCVIDRPGCDPSPSLVPREGYRMTTMLLTRGQVDEAASAEGTRLAGAVFEVPDDGLNVPPAGTYTIEARQLKPDGAETSLGSAGALGRIEITAEQRAPTPLTLGGIEDLIPIAASVPRPAVRVVQAPATGESFAMASDVTIDFPSEKIRIAGVSRAASAAIAELVPIDSDTVRVLFVRDRRLPQPIDGSVGEASFELVFDLLPDASPVNPEEFAIAREVSHGLNGEVLEGTRFVVKEVF